MKKKKAQKKRNKLVATGSKADHPPPSAIANDEENPFDFGGLPDRDFKKNLGCG